MHYGTTVYCMHYSKSIFILNHVEIQVEWLAAANGNRTDTTAADIYTEFLFCLCDKTLMSNNTIYLISLNNE